MQSEPEHHPEADARVHLDLGMAYREMGLLDEAISEAHAAVHDDVCRAEALIFLAECYQEKGYPQKAVECLRRALAATERDSSRFTLIRYLLQQLGADEGDDPLAGSLVGRR